MDFEKYTLHTVSQGLEVSCSSFFDYNILQGASVLELFQVWLVVSRALGEDVLVQKKCFVGMRARSGAVSSAWWHVRTTAFEERVCVWCHVVVFIFMGFGQAGAKSGWGCLKAISWGWWCKSQEGTLLIRKAGSH